MKTDLMVKVHNKFNTNQETKTQKVEIGDSALILSYMRKEGYKFHLRTAIQEYISNALDAHREVGQSRRVEVTAPTSSNPTIVIKDWGPGISPERMENVFCKVGVSSKRANNGQKGGFGAGSKIGLAYTDTFMIRTVVDGLKYNYSVTVSNDASGEVILLGTPSKVSEENGTEIQFVVRPEDIPKAHDAIRRFCFFAEPHETPVVNNIMNLKTIGDFNKTLIGYDKKTLDSAYIISKDENSFPYHNLGVGDKVIIVLDGIPYPCDQEYMQILARATNLIKGTLVIKFKTGVLRPQLSREGIMYCDQNTDAIKGIATLVEKRINEEVDHYLKDKASPSTFLASFTEILRKYNISAKSFKDYVFTASGRIESPLFKKVVIDYRYIPSHSTRIKRIQNEFLTSSNMEGLFWADTSVESMGKIGRRINEYLRTRSKIQVIYNQGLATDKEFNDMKEILGLKSIHEVELLVYEKEQSERKKKAKEVVCLHVFESKERGTKVIKNTETLALDDIDKNTKYVYINYADYASLRNKLAPYVAFCGGYTFCGIGKQDLVKIEESELTNFMSFEDFEKNYKYNETDMYRVARSQAKNIDYMYNCLIHLNGIKNKDLVKLIDQYKIMLSGYEVEAPPMIKKLYQADKNYIKFLNEDKEMNTILKELYLFTECYHRGSSKRNSEQLVEFLNWKLK